MTMQPAQLIVVEQREWLQVLLKAESLDLRTQVQATSSETGLSDLLAKHPYSFVVFYITEEHNNCSEMVQLVAQTRKEFPHAALAAVGEPTTSDWEFALREAGLIHIQFDCRRFGDLLKLTTQKIEQAPQAKQTFREAVWNRLPWNL